MIKFWLILAVAMHVSIICLCLHTYKHHSYKTVLKVNNTAHFDLVIANSPCLTCNSITSAPVINILVNYCHCHARRNSAKRLHLSVFFFDVFVYDSFG